MRGVRGDHNSIGSLANRKGKQILPDGDEYVPSGRWCCRVGYIAICEDTATTGEALKAASAVARGTIKCLRKVIATPFAQHRYMIPQSPRPSFIINGCNLPQRLDFPRH
jgi:hypothetical protein